MPREIALRLSTVPSGKFVVDPHVALVFYGLTFKSLDYLGVLNPSTGDRQFLGMTRG